MRWVCLVRIASKRTFRTSVRNLSIWYKTILRYPNLPEKWKKRMASVPNNAAVPKILTTAILTVRSMVVRKDTMVGRWPEERTAWTRRTKVAPCLVNRADIPDFKEPFSQVLFSQVLLTPPLLPTYHFHMGANGTGVWLFGKKSGHETVR